MTSGPVDVTAGGTQNKRTDTEGLYHVISHHSNSSENKTGIKPLYCSDDKIEKNEMGGPCSAYGGEKKCIQGFGGET
jgi:hypothetical protein